MNLLQRINEVRRELPYIQKDKSVSTGGGSYRAVTHDTVTAMVRPSMIKHGIVCWPNLVECLSMPFESNTTTATDKAGVTTVTTVKAKQFRHEATYDFTFANAEDPKDCLVIRIQAHAMDNADKAPGKALSYAKKYAVLKLFEIETGEDDESRFGGDGMDENSLNDYLAAIEAASDMEELKASFADAYKAAGDAKDKEAQKATIKAKDARKSQLSGAQK